MATAVFPAGALAVAVLATDCDDDDTMLAGRDTGIGSNFFKLLAKNIISKSEQIEIEEHKNRKANAYLWFM